MGIGLLNERFTLEELAQKPRWSLEQMSALEGNSRGALLRNWASNIRRRWGDEVLQQLRETTGLTEDILPEEPDDQGWYPSSYQIRLTDAILYDCCDGDPLLFEQYLREDGLRHDDGKAQAWAKRLGPQLILRLARRVHGQLYTMGSASSKVGWGKASIRVEGARLFGNPIWQLVQVMALRSVMVLADRRNATVHAQLLTPTSSDLHIRW
ncbi:MAG: hypothetical protein EP343_12855 [Deltaproteobacteria bacterium]|nr:MAG: hypothetical protein EP343_12855 [Deltaproteobacteria bacterium]